jgi:hypothetical protein
LKLFLEHTNAGSEDQSGTANAKLATDLTSQQLLNSRDGILSGSDKSAALNAMMNPSDIKLSTPKKEGEGQMNPISGSKSLQDESAEKFKMNEKHLKEERLRKESKMELSLTVDASKKGTKSTTPG